MRATVVDASAIAAVLFDEQEAAPIVASVTGRLVAPTLLRYELASVCTTKLIRHPQRAADIHTRYRLFPELALDLFEPDWDDLPALARRWALSACDAAYLQLALARKAPLVTLDARLAAAYDNATRSVS
ncbi:MAG TPA: type II toxin-antitoxin system VapC family toxin [Burkholderiales bacterium]|nr:type II toxin-antitoxin system VapC family toxin [Burkholderiales bacterium]